MKPPRISKTIHLEEDLFKWLEEKAKADRRSFVQTVAIRLEKLKKEEEESNEHPIN